MKDLKAAVRAAVAKRPADATDIVRIAIMSKSSKRRAPFCERVREIVDAAMSAAPEKARAISEMAQNLAPDCADEINQLLRASSVGQGAVGPAVPGSTDGDTDGTDGAPTGEDFGGGFGPGFPGSPTFGGSSPSGGFALPTPFNAPVTESSNS